MLLLELVLGISRGCKVAGGRGVTTPTDPAPRLRKLEFILPQPLLSHGVVLNYTWGQIYIYIAF